MAAASYSLKQAATEIANTISAGVSVDLDAATHVLGHDSIAAAVKAYNNMVRVIQMIQPKKHQVNNADCIIKLIDK